MTETVPEVMSSSLASAAKRSEAVRSIEQQLKDARSERNADIEEAYASGIGLNRISQHTGLSIPGVKKIIAKGKKKEDK